MIEEKGGTEALVNVPRDDALQVHALLGVRELRITLPVFRCAERNTRAGRVQPCPDAAGARAAIQSLVAESRRLRGLHPLCAERTRGGADAAMRPLPC